MTSKFWLTSLKKLSLIILIVILLPTSYSFAQKKSRKKDTTPTTTVTLPSISSLVCTKPTKPSCLIESILLEGVKTKTNLYYTLEMTIPPGANCTNYKISLEGKRLQSQTWEIIKDYKNVCSINTQTADSCDCSCSVEIVGELKQLLVDASIKNPNEIAEVKASILHEKSKEGFILDALCSATNKIALK